MLNNLTAINWEDFHFLRPDLLWLLLPAGITLVIGLISLREHVKWKKFIAPHLQPFVIQKGSEKIKKWLQLVLFIFISLAILGAAGPSWKRIELPGKILETPLVILLDLSQSMMAADIQPSRLERAKFKITDFLKEKPGARIALVGYAGTAHTVVPLTRDYNIISGHVNSLSPGVIPYPGTNLGDALVLADTITSMTTAPGTVMLFTDDITDETFRLLQQYVNQGKNKVVVVPMNTPGGANVPGEGRNKFMRDGEGNIVRSALNTDVLNQLSSVEGIEVNALTLDKSDMELLANKISGSLEFKEQDEEKEDECQDEGLWLAIPFAFLVLIWFRKGWVIYSLFIMISFSSCSNDSKVTDFWLAKDYQGQQHYDKGEYDEAAELYIDPLHRGVAWYKSGDYEKAAAAFEEDTSAMGAYNLGLAYYKNGDYEAAGLAFGRAAELEPEMGDAKQNQALMQQMITGTDEAGIEDATEASEQESAQNLDNTGGEDLSGGGEEATEEDMKKERAEEIAATGTRTAKELEEVPPDFEPGEKENGQKVVMQKVDDDPALFLKRKFRYQAKTKDLKPKNNDIKW